MKSRRQLYCTNCKSGMPKQFVFQGVVICEKCHTIVQRAVEKAKAEIRMLFLTYTDMLRVSLVKGEMHLPVLPKSINMPKKEMEKAFQNTALRIGEENAQGQKAQGDGEVCDLRSDSPAPNGEV